MTSMRRTWMAVAVLLCLGTGVAGAVGPTVSGVSALQRPGTRYVDITYNLSDSDSATLSVSVQISTNGGATYFTPGNVSGDVGSSVARGNNRKIVWDARATLPAAFYANMKARVTADDDPTDGDYMVIDLSAGPSASSYPVTYLDTVPPGGWTDVYKTTKLVMRRIPAGTFTMGSPSGELGRYIDETQHQVTLTKDFYIGVFEVTQKQWERVMGNWPSYFTNVTCCDSRPVEQVSYNEIRENPLPVIDQWTAGRAIYPNWPESSAVHADSFMGKLRAKTGMTTLDLPTESQWEYACRAGTTTALNSGQNLTNELADMHINAVGRYWFNGGSGEWDSQVGDTSVGTAKVGSYQANAWGLYDMHGNVWEWCLDRYGGYPGAVTDPVGAASGSRRVGRGGSWGNCAGDCRSADRSSQYSPYYQSHDVGFRPSRSLP